MISEARTWSSGSAEAPLSSPVLTVLPDGAAVYFLKPGKEASRDSRPNPFDMTPVVGSQDERWAFEDIWSHLAKMSMLLDDRDAFKAILVLLYRNAFLMDHEVTGAGVRYLPKGELVSFMKEMDARTNGVLPHGLLGYLHFLDILGWNEDVKYQSPENLPVFNPNHRVRVGRINTILTCIRVSYTLCELASDILLKVSNRSEIDFRKVLSAMQHFSNSGGISTPSDSELLEWLSPLLRRSGPKGRSQSSAEHQGFSF